MKKLIILVFLLLQLNSLLAENTVERVGDWVIKTNINNFDGSKFTEIYTLSSNPISKLFILPKKNNLIMGITVPNNPCLGSNDNDIEKKRSIKDAVSLQWKINKDKILETNFWVFVGTKGERVTALYDATLNKDRPITTIWDEIFKVDLITVIFRDKKCNLYPIDIEFPVKDLLLISKEYIYPILAGN